MSGSLYTPILQHIGKLPDRETSDPVIFDISKYLPENARDVFIYAFATTYDECETLRRAYFELYTVGADKKAKYMQYMNVAVAPSVAVTSGNMWFPIPGEKKLKVKLVEVDPPPNAKGKSIAYRRKGAKENDFSEYSDVFIIGFR